MIVRHDQRENPRITHHVQEDSSHVHAPMTVPMTPLRIAVTVRMTVLSLVRVFGVFVRMSSMVVIVLPIRVVVGMIMVVSLLVSVVVRMGMPVRLDSGAGRARSGLSGMRMGVAIVGVSVAQHLRNRLVLARSRVRRTQSLIRPDRWRHVTA